MAADGRIAQQSKAVRDRGRVGLQPCTALQGQVGRVRSVRSQLLLPWFSDLYLEFTLDAIVLDVMP